MELVDIFKALGDENRLRIFNVLIHGELCVCEIESVLGLNQSNVSRHLNKLKSTRLIISRKDAQWIYYSVDPGFAEENANLISYLKDKFASTDFSADSARLYAYKDSKFTCVDLRKDPSDVMNNLNTK
jgi:ArsR family transcriptional regulator